MFLSIHWYQLSTKYVDGRSLKRKNKLLIKNFPHIIGLLFLVISTTTATTTAVAIVTRAPCLACACIVTPCPVAVVTNPCLPNPWLVVSIDIFHVYLCFSLYSQNMGGCGVVNNAAQCWCSNYYVGYYCQFSMFKSRVSYFYFIV